MGLFRSSYGYKPDKQMMKDQEAMMARGAPQLAFNYAGGGDSGYDLLGGNQKMTPSTVKKLTDAERMTKGGFDKNGLTKEQAKKFAAFQGQGGAIAAAGKKWAAKIAAENLSKQPTEETIPGQMMMGADGKPEMTQGLLPEASKDITDQAEQYYGGIENNAIEGLKQGQMTAMQQGVNAMGRRGMGAGGASAMMMGNIGDKLSRDISSTKRDVGFQKANAMTDVAKFNATMADQRRAARMNEIQGQYGLDSASRAEKTGYARMPYEDNYRNAQLMMGIGSQQKSGSILGGVVGGLSNLAGGAGKLATGWADYRNSK